MKPAGEINLKACALMILTQIISPDLAETCSPVRHSVHYWLFYLQAIETGHIRLEAPSYLTEDTELSHFQQ